MAGYAPSVHNTQPWRWRISGDGMDLMADRDRQLTIADPQGRLLTISCGAALHHATIALAAEGWQAKVRLLDGPDHLARVTLGPRIEATVEVTAEMMRHLQAIRVRHTDRRPVADTPITAETVDVLRDAAAAYGIDIHLLTADQVIELGAASARADRIELLDPQQRDELTYWIGGDRPEGTGIPDSALTEEPTGGPIPGRDFVRAGTLPTAAGTDRAASYVVLFGMGDEPQDWLRAGEALSACWLAATESGVSVLPFSAVIEVPATREVLRRLLSSIGYPYLVLRLGIAPADRPGPPHTPRLPAKQLIEIS